MNKIRLIKIYELRGKMHPLEAYMIYILKNLSKSKSNKYLDYVIAGIIYFRYDIRTDFFWLYGLQSNFECSYEESRKIVRYLLDKHFDKNLYE